MMRFLECLADIDDGILSACLAEDRRKRKPSNQGEYVDLVL